MNETIEYYNINASKYFNDTISADMSIIYEKFEEYLSNDSSILDCGCGSGRDIKYFLSKGYNVSGLDASEKMCKYASELTNINVICMNFNEIDIHEKFDGIWACASLLHLESNMLLEVFIKLRNALKENGVLYVSFKYGDFEGKRNERYFTDMTEKKLNDLISSIPKLEIVETWISEDVRKDRNFEKWLNAILRKQ